MIKLKDLLLENTDKIPVPPEPGTIPIPSNHLRLYHYTNTDPAIIKKEGLRLSHARGNTYGEPDAIWCSLQLPHDNKIFVEFSVAIDDKRFIQFAGPAPDPYKSPKDYEGRGSDFTLFGDVLPNEFLAIHEPWHHHYRYLIAEGERFIANILAGEFDFLLDRPNSDEAKAILAVKHNYKDSIDESEQEDSFLKHHDTGYIPSDAYKNYEETGGLSWLGEKSKYKVLLDKKQHGQYEVEYRQTGDRNVYVKYNDLKAERDADGNLVYMSPEEIRAGEYPEFDTSIVAFINDKPIGLASNEFGAVGIWVEGPYQKLGIGTELLEKHIEQRPRVKRGAAKIGQMTDAGRMMTRSYFRKMALKHGEDWFEKIRIK